MRGAGTGGRLGGWFRMEWSRYVREMKWSRFGGEEKAGEVYCLCVSES